MSEQVLVQFGVDKELKQEVSEIYEELGMDLPTALRMFMKKSKQVKDFPLMLSCRLIDQTDQISYLPLMH